MLFLFASLALSTLASKFASAPLVLGSGSSSRAAILRDCGLKFEVRKPGIDEKAIRHDSAKDLVLALGLAKAAALRDDPDLAARGALLITGDQVVVADGGRILEKPEDEAEARAFIDSYGRDPPRTVGSLVVTDAASGQQWSAVDEACVHFSPIPDDVVDQLLEEGDVYYCAGGLMVEHPLVQPYVQRMDGSMDSIMGLCIATLEKLLDEAIAARSCSRPPPPPSPPPPSRSPPVRMGLTDLFDQTPPDERYNAVLLTMLAPAKGSGGQTVERRKQALPNALNLIDEMTTNRLRLSPNVLISLVDASLDAGEAELSAALLSARANGACRSFGGRRWAPPERPPASALASLPPLPQADRDAEPAGAAAAGSSSRRVRRPWRTRRPLSRLVANWRLSRPTATPTRARLQMCSGAALGGWLIVISTRNVQSNQRPSSSDSFLGCRAARRHRALKHLSRCCETARRSNVRSAAAPNYRVSSTGYSSGSSLPQHSRLACVTSGCPSHRRLALRSTSSRRRGGGRRSQASMCSRAAGRLERTTHACDGRLHRRRQCCKSATA